MIGIKHALTLVRRDSLRRVLKRGMGMKKSFGSLLILLALALTACGRDEGQGAPAPQPGPEFNAPVAEEPGGGYTAGGGYCGLLCRWRLRRMQRRQGWCE